MRDVTATRCFAARFKFSVLADTLQLRADESNDCAKKRSPSGLGVLRTCINTYTSDLPDFLASNNSEIDLDDCGIVTPIQFRHVKSFKRSFRRNRRPKLDNLRYIVENLFFLL